MTLAVMMVLLAAYNIAFSPYNQVDMDYRQNHRDVGMLELMQDMTVDIDALQTQVAELTAWKDSVGLGRENK